MPFLEYLDGRIHLEFGASKDLEAIRLDRRKGMYRLTPVILYVRKVNVFAQ